MDALGQVAVDWRDADAYAPLLAADRSLIAWEWLRRDAGYRAAARAAFAGAAAEPGLQAREWGLHAFEDPDCCVPLARPIWSAGPHPAVLEADSVPADRSSDSFDLSRFRGLSTVIRDAAGIEHLLLCDGLRAIRLDIVSGTIAGAPAALRYRLTGIAAAAGPLLTLRRLLALHANGRFSRALHAPEKRAWRWLLMLRARDALAAGAGQREIALTLISPSANEPRWRSAAPSLRSRAQRLVRTARRMAAGGYLELLR